MCGPSKLIEGIEMIYAGIDGCKAGWLVLYHDGKTFNYAVLKHINELRELLLTHSRILIDIPIGLTSEGFERTIERKMRSELKGRSSTVFNAPARAAIQTTDKAEARRRNIALTGKSLSEQSLNIADKIKEVDDFITVANDKKSTMILSESHPEICFKFLAGHILTSKKSTIAGIDERLAVLKRYEPTAETIYNNILDNTLRKKIQRDDIVDALCLCMVNKLAGKYKLSFLTDAHTEDEKGIQVGIGYYDGLKE